jgi:sulfate transport system ATP-binding protein
MSIEVQQIAKRFGSFTALDQVSLAFADGELTALLGPSGCGKTTLLRIIAGLEVPDAGRVLLGGEDASQRQVRERQVGFVFQHYALFKHMTVFENIAFGLRVKPRHLRPSEAQIREKVHRLLDLVQLDWLAGRFPAQLSGGQRQRIALARALAVEPRVLLLDEPFGALDAKVRKQLRRWLRRLHDELQVTSIFVTHDQEEALEVADRVVLMNHGKVEQVGTPQQVYDQPASAFVYSFLGNVNLFHGRLHQGVLETGTVRLPIEDAAGGAENWAANQNTDQDANPAANPDANSEANSEGQNGIGYVRPHDLEIEPWQAGGTGIPVRLLRAHVLGPLAQLELEREDTGDLIEATIPGERFRALGAQVGQSLLVKPRRLQVFFPERAAA